MDVKWGRGSREMPVDVKRGEGVQPGVASDVKRGKVIQGIASGR